MLRAVVIAWWRNSPQSATTPNAAAASDNAAAASDLLWLDIHLDYASVRRDQAVTPAGRESDARAEQENEIGAFIAAAGMRGWMNRTEGAEAQGMVLGNCAACLRVGHYRSVC
jgi:hypothetical protein